MYVPFDQIGDGQVGRLVYQVIGKDGPFFNPRNITYLPPGMVPGTGVPDMSQLAIGVAGLNFLVSAGNLALSTAILREVQIINSKLNVAIHKLTVIDQKLDQLALKVKKIDCKLEESHLREAMNESFKRALSDRTIDFSALIPMIGDLDNLLGALGEDDDSNAYVGCDGLSLSSDVRSKLDSLFEVLFRTRMFAASRYNRSVYGDPLSVVMMDPVRDYLATSKGSLTETITSTFAYLHAGAILQSEVLSMVNERFTWSDSEDQNEFKNLFDAADDQFFSFLEDSIVLPFISNMPKAILQNEDADSRNALCSAYIHHWLWRSDAGLLHRVRVELIGIRDGYEHVFWPQILKGEDSKPGEIVTLECVADLKTSA